MSSRSKWDTLERETIYLLADPDRHTPICSVADIGHELDFFD